MADKAPCHLYANLKISKLSEFSDVYCPLHVSTVYRSHTGINVYAHCTLHHPKQECLSALCRTSFVDVYLAYLKSYGHLKIVKCIGMY